MLLTQQSRSVRVRYYTVVTYKILQHSQTYQHKTFTEKTNQLNLIVCSIFDLGFSIIRSFKFKA